MKLHKGDKVKITVGKDRGKDGVIDRIFPKSGTVAVAGVNLFKRHLKPQGEGKKGEIKEFPRPLLAAKVALVCPKCQKVTRIGYQVGKKKVRVCKKCQQII